MDGITDLLDRPGFYVLEFIALALVLYVFVDLKNTRKMLFDKLEEIRKEVLAEIKETKKSISDHEEGCSEQRVKDARWKGRVAEKLGLGSDE